VVPIHGFISSTDQFSIQKWSAVFIWYHKRARRGKYDRQPAGRRRDGKRISGPNRLIFYEITLLYTIAIIAVIKNNRSFTDGKMYSPPGSRNRFQVHETRQLLVQGVSKMPSSESLLQISSGMCDMVYGKSRGQLGRRSGRPLLLQIIVKWV
jgi:hypothetical protein